MHNWGADFRKREVEELIKKHGLPDGIELQKLLEYNPDSNQ